MEDSILLSIRQSVIGDASADYFDSKLVMYINTALNTLTQIGVGPELGFTISDSSATWSDFLGSDKLLETVKTYVSMSVELMFSPPSSSAVMDNMKQKCAELESRISYEVDR